WGLRRRDHVVGLVEDREAGEGLRGVVQAQRAADDRAERVARVARAARDVREDADAAPHREGLRRREQAAAQTVAGRRVRVRGALAQAVRLRGEEARVADARLVRVDRDLGRHLGAAPRRRFAVWSLFRRVGSGQCGRPGRPFQSPSAFSFVAPANWTIHARGLPWNSRTVWPPSPRFTTSRSWPTGTVDGSRAVLIACS